MRKCRYKCTVALTLTETSKYVHPQPLMIQTIYHKLQSHILMIQIVKCKMKG